MPAYIAGEITIHDPVVYEKHTAVVPAGIAKYGGRYLVRGGTTTALEGEYSPAKPIRQSCASTKRLLIDGPAFDPANG